MGAVQDVRDIVLIVVGIVWSLIFLVVLAVTAVAGVLATRYLGKAQTFIDEQGGALLDTVHTTVESVRERTASLPHYDTGVESARRRIESPHVPHPRQVKLGLNLPIPFLHRKKPWYQRLLSR